MLAGTLALSGCGAGTAGGSGPLPPEQSAQDALDALSITPDQEDQLLAVAGKFAVVLSKSGRARRAFTDGLLKALKNGSVDAKIIDPLRLDFEKAIREATPDVLALLNELHGVLTPTQRAQLIEGIASRSEESKAKRKAANKKFIDDLDIGFLQKLAIGKAIRDKMATQREAFDQLKVDAKAAGEAFKKDDFDATKLAIAKTDLGKLYLESAVIIVAALAPELEQPQRTKLAGKIRHQLLGRKHKARHR